MNALRPVRPKPAPTSAIWVQGRYDLVEYADIPELVDSLLDNPLNMSRAIMVPKDVRLPILDVTDKVLDALEEARRDAREQAEHERLEGAMRHV